MDCKLGNTLLFHIQGLDGSGVLIDPTGISFEVYGNSDTPVITGGSMTKRNSKTGFYYGSITCTTGNGFAVGSYCIRIVLTIDGISSCKAIDFTVSDKIGFKLASDGLDSISITEPSGDPAGWNFRQKFMWFFARFLNKHKKDAATNIIEVYNQSGTKITEQSYTEVSGSETVEKVAQP